MRILIVEDEYSIARDIEWHCRQILGKKIVSLEIIQTLKSASDYLFKNPIDLLLLDLNLSGKSGYELLKLAVSGSFHTIVISAHTDQAIDAFQYGVLDFVPKPFDQERLQMALTRFFDHAKRAHGYTQYLSVRKHKINKILSIEEVVFFKAANYYVEAVLKNGDIEILDKSMDRLVQILPPHFFRIHRSYIADINYIESFTPLIKGTSSVLLKNNEKLPLSKAKYKSLRKILKS